MNERILLIGEVYIYIQVFAMPTLKKMDYGLQEPLVTPYQQEISAGSLILLLYLLLTTKCLWDMMTLDFISEMTSNHIYRLPYR